MVFSKSSPSSIDPSTSSLAPKTPLNRWNLSSSSSRMRCSATLPLLEKLTTTTSCFCPKRWAAADALLDALRVPRQVVVDDHRAELEVDALRGRLGGDHDRALVAEVVHERLAAVRGKDAGDDVAALVASIHVW